MLGLNLRKHFREFRNYFLNHQYEQTESGIYFPRAHALATGVYTHWVTGSESDARSDHNVIPDEGLYHFLSVALKGGTQYSTWYLMIHSGTGTPDSTTNAANYDAQLTEITTGYTQSTRVTWAGDAVSLVTTDVVNDTTPAAFTINGSVTVNGAGLTTVSTKGSTSGVLLSAGKFSAARNLSDTDQFNLKYKVDLDAA